MAKITNKIHFNHVKINVDKNIIIESNRAKGIIKVYKLDKVVEKFEKLAEYKADTNKYLIIRIKYLNSNKTEVFEIHSYHIANEELILIHLIDNEFVKEYINLDAIEYDIKNINLN
ncbi:hypothetical protein ACMGE9_12290 [Macrococcus sp. EM39E]|uniref:hypothetical protein n=1 Tax=Macrococcus animalis TaxID=3395467 RepID=UPI0039BE6E45